MSEALQFTRDYQKKIPFVAHLIALVHIPRSGLDQLHAAQGIREVTVLPEKVQCFLPVPFLPGHGVGQLEGSRDFSAVQPAIKDGQRIPIYILRVPPAPERRLSVNVDQIKIVGQDVIDNPAVIRRDPLPFAWIGRGAFP